jgi:predicted exporter
MLAATTTAAAFLALTLADFRGFSQFGGVAAAGVGLCLLSYLVVFPALVFAIERVMPLRLLGYTVAREADGSVGSRSVPLGAKTVTAAVVLAGAGVFFGLDASSTADDANAYDTANPEHTRAGLQALVDDSEQSAFQANVALGIGGAAMLAGAAMLWLASDGPFRPRRVTARPVANGALLRWTF